MEKERQKALQVNYTLGNYGTKYCGRCGYAIERYENIQKGECEECIENS